ncbi:hypothetical protein K1719_019613 [Acacia pycnantha]|nr:hypothetical protein K1719_019613 [Acacia pycnantha]
MRSSERGRRSGHLREIQLITPSLLFFPHFNLSSILSNLRAYNIGNVPPNPKRNSPPQKRHRNQNWVVRTRPDSQRVSATQTIDLLKKTQSLEARNDEPLGNTCLAAVQAYDAATKSIEALNAAQLKFQDIMNSPALDAACKVYALSLARKQSFPYFIVERVHGIAEDFIKLAAHLEMLGGLHMSYKSRNGLI